MCYWGNEAAKRKQPLETLWSLRFCSVTLLSHRRFFMFLLCLRCLCPTQGLVLGLLFLLLTDTLFLWSSFLPIDSTTTYRLPVNKAMCSAQFLTFRLTTPAAYLISLGYATGTSNSTHAKWNLSTPQTGFTSQILYFGYYHWPPVSLLGTWELAEVPPLLSFTSSPGPLTRSHQFYFLSPTYVILFSVSSASALSSLSSSSIRTMKVVFLLILG